MGHFPSCLKWKYRIRREWGAWLKWRATSFFNWFTELFYLICRTVYPGSLDLVQTFSNKFPKKLVWPTWCSFYWLHLLYYWVKPCSHIGFFSPFFRHPVFHPVFLNGFCTHSISFSKKNGSKNALRNRMCEQGLTAELFTWKIQQWCNLNEAQGQKLVFYTCTWFMT